MKKLIQTSACSVTGIHDHTGAVRQEPARRCDFLGFSCRNVQSGGAEQTTSEPIDSFIRS